ncbi:hypothetical protein FHS29_000226 [Saccharothrix tamanrassetensis]|uniref:XRE family transcriptional regulator n=1 Tax=Saccharothrix tamanrassetensis TaxID=1051531 RepID=A0A841CD30_9PSEU|nr:hypothetical protein [Saccharothrix tamanrassetensis]MBB5953656.1 hypothetical protein [Saccharothrix tamanrassetensis]
MTTPTHLRTFLDRLGWPPEQLAREINRRCGDGTISPKAPYHWLKGAYPRRRIPYAVAEILSEHLNEPIDISVIWPTGLDDDTAPENEEGHEPTPRPAQVPDLAPPARHTELVRHSCESLTLSREVAATNVDEAAFDRFEAELSAIGQSYAYVPPSTLAHRTTLFRDRIAELLHGRQRPAQRVRLLSYAAKSCVLLAWMADDLDDRKAAHNHATAAWDLADLADRHDARRWVRAVQARQSYWLGHFVESAQLAVDGTTYRAADGLDALLLLQQARAWAAARMDADARRALADWRALPGSDAADGRHPMLVIGPEVQSYLAGATLLALHRPENALTELDRSLRLQCAASPASRSRDLEILVRAHIARCHAVLGDLRAGLDALVPVPDPESTDLTGPVRASLAEARRALSGASGDRAAHGRLAVLPAR